MILELVALYVAFEALSQLSKDRGPVFGDTGLPVPKELLFNDEGFVFESDRISARNAFYESHPEIEPMWDGRRYFAFKSDHDKAIKEFMEEHRRWSKRWRNGSNSTTPVVV